MLKTFFSNKKIRELLKNAFSFSEEENITLALIANSLVLCNFWSVFSNLQIMFLEKPWKKLKKLTLDLRFCQRENH